jgi:hypothetical protein
MSAIQESKNKDLTQHSEIENIQTAAREDSGFEEFLTFKKGKYFVGDDEISLGTKFIAYAKAWTKVWIKFVDGERVEHKVYRVALGERAPEREELDDLDKSKWSPGLDDKPSDPWVLQYLVPFENVSDGEVVIFKTPSTGGRIAVAALCEAWAKHASHDSGCGSPIIKLAAGTMPSKKWGKVPAPHFEILSWEGDQPAADVLPPNNPKNSGGNADLDDEIPF